ncbi:bifunctional 5,10-methylenetetrahydrofolate dehydrogenase/5,10-methenyltetrahydrofolate cyclohydrolase, partial [Candidatus Microgenomates bacterium]|nr:bifunctional 5,10-methylenetetrahydrofolate dehydrogenase/5,10-methenyltetrahydrofolate cyclohydrolase [Candidatus Microgenomates bacterium]
GKQFLPLIGERIINKVDVLKAKHVVPVLCIVKSKNADDVNTYISQKVKRGAELGVQVRVVEFAQTVLDDPAALATEVKKMNADPHIHGIIFQKPSHPNVNDAIEYLVDPAKDVDGFLPASPHKPPVYRGVLQILEHIYQKDFPEILPSKTFVVIGKGKTGGEPVIEGLKKDGISTVHVIDSKTTPEEKAKCLKYASIVVSAVGMRNPVDPTLLPEQGILIDFGVHFENGKIRPDFAESDIQERLQYYTTTPGGIGPMTPLFLIDNTVDAALSLTS